MAPPSDRPRTVRHSGSLPIAIQCQFEHVAALRAPSPMGTFAREMLCASIVQSVRGNDALNTRLFRDEVEPDISLTASFAA